MGAGLPLRRCGRDARRSCWSMSARAPAIARSSFRVSARCCRSTWSPDGRSIAFSALAGGWTDLYVTDVATGSLRQLTDDAFADLQPAWSHDGRSIAFATERFSSDLSTLRFGRPQLAIMDVATNTARHVDLASI